MTRRASEMVKRYIPRERQDPENRARPLPVAFRPVRLRISPQYLEFPEAHDTATSACESNLGRFLEVWLDRERPVVHVARECLPPVG